MRRRSLARAGLRGRKPPQSYSIANSYITKMAAVFMFATSKVMSHAGLAPRWLVFAGYGLSLMLLFGSHYVARSFIVFPFWMLLLSGWMLVDARAPECEALVLRSGRTEANR
jgi:hypothetical protein